MSPSFLKNIEKKDNGCWEYLMGKTKSGYGRFTFGGKRIYAHRYSYKFFNGHIHDNLFVCHSCDNPSCVNPSHLWLGTNKDNMIDKTNKGRSINQNSLKTKCLNGHNLDVDNLYIKPGDKSRNCIICRKKNRRLRYLKLGV